MNSISHSLKSKLFLASLFLILSTTFASAQIDEAPDDVNDEPTVPIDGFVITGLVAGSLLGIRKLRKSENA